MFEPGVIYEDKDFVAVNKPSGLLVHPVRGREGSQRASASNGVHEARIAKRKASDVPRSTLHASREPTLVDWLVGRYPEIKEVGDDPALRPGSVHRLDKETSGIMVIARTKESFEYLKSLFQTRQIHKIYRALVFGDVKEKKGIIEKPIGIKNGTLKRSVRSEKMVKEAITEYRVVKNFQFSIFNFQSTPQSKILDSKFSLLEVEPKTGRTHQIRVHLASIGHPIVGDRLYGTKESRVKSQAMGARLMLHALSLEFTTVEGRRVKLEAEPPADFRGTISSIAQ